MIEPNSTAKPDSASLDQAVAALRQGGLIAYPTEAVWGLGCDPYNSDAFDRLLVCKKRPSSKGVILVASQLQHLQPLLDGLTDEQITVLATEREEPTTWVIPANQNAPSWICGEHSTIAVRLSRHPVVQALCDSFGGMIVSTSANLSGEPPARSQYEVESVFGSTIDVYVSGESGGQARPSRIINLLTGQQLR